jgi:hypothetical protein
MNLADTQIAVKKLLIGIAVLTVVYYSGKFLLIQGVGIYRKLFPVEVPIPEAKWGKLPTLKMPSVTIEGSPQYILDTVNGNLPTFQDRIKVFPIIEPSTTLLSEQGIQKLAGDLGFVGSYTKVSTSGRRWVDGTNQRTFDANTITKNFTLETTLSKLASISSSTASITDSDATGMVSTFIKSKTLMNSTDIDNLYTSTLSVQIILGNLREIKPVPTPPKIIKVDVYRNLLYSPATTNRKATIYKIIGPNPKDSLINFYVTNNSNIFKFPTINFTYWEVNYKDGSEYYLSNISTVWQAIQQNQGIIAYARTKSGDFFVSQNNIAIGKVEIRDIYLAYYEPKELSKYLQPIYVFEGQFETKAQLGKLSEQGEIVIYFPAVRGDFVN